MQDFLQVKEGVQDFPQVKEAWPNGKYASAPSPNPIPSLFLPRLRKASGSSPEKFLKF